METNRKSRRPMAYRIEWNMNTNDRMTVSKLQFGGHFSFESENFSAWYGVVAMSTSIAHAVVWWRNRNMHLLRPSVVISCTVWMDGWMTSVNDSRAWWLASLAGRPAGRPDDDTNDRQIVTRSTQPPPLIAVREELLRGTDDVYGYLCIINHFCVLRFLSVCADTP